MAKRKKKEPTLLSGILMTLALFLIVPLPFALYLGGTEWIFVGWHAVPKEFIASYIVGFVVFFAQFVYIRFTEWCEKKKEDVSGGRESK